MVVFSEEKACKSTTKFTVSHELTGLWYHVSALNDITYKSIANFAIEHKLGGYGALDICGSAW